MRFPDIGHARANVRRVVREALDDRDAVLGVVAEDELTADLKAAYRGTYRWHARAEAIENRVDAALSVVTVLLIVGAPGVLCWLISGRAEPDYAVVGLCVVSWLVGLLTFTTMGTLVFRLNPMVQVFALVSSEAGLLAGGYLLWQQHGSVTVLLDTIGANWWYIGLTGALIGPASLLVVMIPTSFVVYRVLLRLVYLADPKTALLSLLFQLVRVLRNPRAFAEDREILLSTLDDAARVLETSLWRQTRLSNAASRATWRDRCRQTAQHLRSFDLWVALPRRDTREDLQEEVTTLIHVLVRGCLDELPTVSRRPRRGLATFGNAVRSLLLGLAPLAVLFVAKLAGFEASGPFGGALVVAAVAWLGLFVLTTFDNQAASRVSVLKETAEALSHFKSLRS